MSDAERAGYYTQAELSRLANVGPTAISEAIRRGQLQTVRTLGGTPLIHKDEAERWIRERRPPGRPASPVNSEKSRKKKA